MYSICSSFSCWPQHKPAIRTHFIHEVCSLFWPERPIVPCVPSERQPYLKCPFGQLDVEQWKRLRVMVKRRLGTICVVANIHAVGPTTQFL